MMHYHSYIELDMIPPVGNFILRLKNMLSLQVFQTNLYKLSWLQDPGCHGYRIEDVMVTVTKVMSGYFGWIFSRCSHLMVTGDNMSK